MYNTTNKLQTDSRSSHTWGQCRHISQCRAWCTQSSSGECSDMEAGWCNIPNKGHLQPTHMMIAAYHNKNVQWAYKGWFNWNIDHDWTGGVLVEPVQVVDTCLRTDHSLGKPPAPSTHEGNRHILGIAFDKSTPDKYFANCDTIRGTFTSPRDCRWFDCHLRTPPMIATQMTVVIYIR